MSALTNMTLMIKGLVSYKGFLLSSFQKSSNTLYKEVKKMPDGFNSYEGNAVTWTVYHDKGTTIVHACSEASALQRFMAKYPNLSVIKIVRH